MNDENQKLIKTLIAAFGSKLKPLVEDFVIKNNKAFVTLKAKNYDDAIKLDNYKKECEDILKKKRNF